MTKQASCKLSSTGTHDARKTNNLSATHIHRDVVHHDAVAVDWVVSIPVFNAKDFLTDVRVTSWVAVFHLATNHALDDALLANRILLHVKRLDGVAIANDGGGVGNRLNLI